MKTKQTTPVSTPKKRGRPRKNVLTPVNKKPRVVSATSKDNLRAENDQLHQFCLEWREKCDKQNLEIARIQHLYMDSQAIIKYLESKIIELIGD